MKDQSAEHFNWADQFLRDAEILINSDSFSSSISLSYYASFHGAKAVLSELGIIRKSHQAVWSAFGKNVAVPGLMDKRFHSGGVRLFSDRLDSDYSPGAKDTKDSAQRRLAFASEFVAACRAFIENREKGN
jgi:uncharacterized protein (UPF0332 family)